MEYCKKYVFILNKSEAIVFYEDNDCDIIFIDLEDIKNLTWFIQHNKPCDKNECIELIENFISCMRKIKDWHDYSHRQTCLRNINTAYKLINHINTTYDVRNIMNSVMYNTIYDHRVEKEKELERRRERERYLQYQLEMGKRQKIREEHENTWKRWKSEPKCYRIDTEGMYSTSMTKIMDAYNEYCESEVY